MRSMLPILLLTLFAVSGCNDQASPVKPPTPKERILSDANEIVSNPNAWNTNSRYFADFVRASVELHWEDMSEIKDLKANVADLNIFATQWVQKLDSTQLNTFSRSLQNIVAEVQAGNNAKIVPPAASVNIHSDASQQQLAELFASTTSELSKQQAEQYGQLYKKLIDSYERFYKFAINKNP